MSWEAIYNENNGTGKRMSERARNKTARNWVERLEGN